MAITTALDIVKASLKQLRVLGTGDVLSNEDAQDAFDALNMMLESWSLDHLYVYTESQSNFPFVSGQNSYTIGTGGNFNITRPLKLISAFTRNISGSSTLDYPMEILDDAQQWDLIRNKAVASSWSRAVWYEQSYPLGTLWFYPAPSSGTVYLRFYTPLPSFAALNTAVALPMGYKEALVFNLAVSCAGLFGIEPSAAVAAKATSSAGRLKRYNNKATTTGSETAQISTRRARYNINGDNFY
jgi:hypothetical protein